MELAVPQRVPTAPHRRVLVEPSYVDLTYTDADPRARLVDVEIVVPVYNWLRRVGLRSRVSDASERLEASLGETALDVRGVVRLFGPRARACARCHRRG